MRRDYYPLDLAAEMLSCSKDDLIHLGANNELPISILTANFYIQPIHISHSMPEIKYGSERKRLMKLDYSCLGELEAGNNNAKVFLEREPTYPRDILLNSKNIKHLCNGYIHYELHRQGFIYPTGEMLLERQKRGYNPDDIVPPPILLSECKMVILHEDLRCLQVPKDDDSLQYRSGVEEQVCTTAKQENEVLKKYDREFIINEFIPFLKKNHPTLKVTTDIGKYFKNKNNCSGEIETRFHGICLSGGANWIYTVYDWLTDDGKSEYFIKGSRGKHAKPLKGH